MLLQIYCIIVMLIIQTHSFTIKLRLKQGEIIGIQRETIFEGRTYYAFYRIPYARSPIKKLRFKDPKSPTKWKEPLDATVDYRGACAQPHIVHKHALYGVEDCLYMNIYTPMLTNHADPKLKPVLVFIHGYAFASSLSHIFEADFFVDKDIIVISVAHRIGVFGFLKVNDTDSNANMGLKDILMAIKWIRKNIEQFGGDKKKITVMGNDSGATLLSLLLINKTRKLFSKIILHSGSVFSPSIFQSNYKIERERLTNNLRNMGINDLLTRASTEDIIKASQKIYSSKELINFQRPIVPFTPILERKSNKSLIIYKPEEFYQSLIDTNMAHNMIIGFTSRESISEVIPFIHNSQYLKYLTPHFKFMVPFSDGCFFNYTSSSYKQVATKIKSYYFNQTINEHSLDDFLQYTTDLKIYPIWKFIQAQLFRTKSDIFVYKFGYSGSLNAVKATSLSGATVNVKGASNGDELCYLMKCEPLVMNYKKIYDDVTNRDRIFIMKISEYWANFVKTGNPTPNSQSRLHMWQPMTTNQSNVLLLGKVTKLFDPKVETKMYLFWNEIYKSVYSNNKCGTNLHQEL